MTSRASPFPASPDADELADMLRPVILKLGRQLRREAQRAGVSALDSQLLGLVATRPGIGVSELAAIEQMSSPSMTAHVKRLVAGGWLLRERATDGDQRRSPLKLTAKGQESVTAILRNRNDWLARRIARLPPRDQAVLASAVQLFDEILAIEPDAPSSPPQG
jgi:DNA-binding MarR family transcriptional regulator